MAYDYIIAGAGSAGCVLANRLSADPGATVLLIEGGGFTRSPLIRIPKGAGLLLEKEKYAWRNPTVPFGPRRRPEYWARGKVIGGSSSINGMIYNRGTRADYDELERLGNKGWGWDDILPIFKSFENNEFGASPTRGAGGVVNISVPRDPDPLCDEMMQAAANAGISVVEDINESDGERIGYATSTIKNGRRVSAADAFLKPVRKRPNLTVLTHTNVRRLIIENGRAVGLEVTTRNGAAEFRASREVILALGSLHSPKLLQLSGIGSREVLRDAGVQMYLERDNVGRRMREHRCTALKLRLKADLGYNKYLATSWGQAATGIRYLATRKGPLAAPSFDVVGFTKTMPELDRVDGQIMMGPWTIPDYQFGEPIKIERQPGISCLGMVMRPTSEGSITITSADPDGPLRIDPNYCASDYDRTTIAGLLRRMRQILGQSPIADRVSHETFPGLDTQSDDDLVDSALAGGYCGYHAVGSCAMGPGDEDVVDGQLRVRGIENLRVVDGSVLPRIVAGNLSAPIMAVASRAADFILQDQ